MAAIELELEPELAQQRQLVVVLLVEMQQWPMQV